MGAASVIMVPPIPEQLVEGHTVFATIETLKMQTREEEFAAAVAVLVRDRVRISSETRFPGVLWFNDRYLVDPTASHSVSFPDRYPCTGSVIAVNQGDLIVDQDLTGAWTLANAVYMDESYFITDPNEHQWIVDLWNTTYGRLAWTVSVMNNQATAGTPDDGKCRGPTYLDSPCAPNRIDELDPMDPTAIPQQCTPTNAPVTDTPIPDPRHKSPGDNGMGYPCPDCAMIRYNAVLYFRLKDLDVAAAPKNHTEPTGDDWAFDPAACHNSNTNAWNCPGGDDDREGNSHPYNPDFPAVPYDGRNNHGGSDSCGGILDSCHATRNIDIYFGYQTPPPIRTFVVLDIEGADAPYHCADSNPTCQPGDAEDQASDFV